MEKDRNSHYLKAVRSLQSRFLSKILNTVELMCLAIVLFAVTAIVAKELNEVKFIYMASFFLSLALALMSILLWKTKNFVRFRFSPAIGVSLIILTLVRQLMPGINALRSNSQSTIQNIDQRFLLSIATSVSKDGDFTRRMDADGITYDYHSMPADISGAWSYLFGIDLALSLLIVIPGVSIVVIAFALGVLMRKAIEIRDKPFMESGFLVIGISLTFPFLFGDFESYLPREISLNYLGFSGSLMINSLFGLQIGFCSVVLCLSSKKINKSVGNFGLITLVFIKPHYIPAFIIIATILHWKLNSNCSQTERSSRIKDIATKVLVAFISLFLLSTQETTSGLALGFSIWDTYIFKSQSLFLLIFGFSIPLILIKQRIQFGMLQPTVNFNSNLLLFFIVYAILILLTGTIEFRTSEEYLDFEGQIVVPAVSPQVATQELRQLFPPLVIILCVLFIDELMRAYSRIYVAKSRLISFILTFVSLTTLTSYNFLSFVYPQDSRFNYEVVNLEAFAQVSSIAKEYDGLAISSDLTDPDANHRRRLVAHYLIFISEQPFYLANFRYFVQMSPESLRRLEFLQELFESKTIEPHVNSLVKRNITYIYVSSRCVPKWSDTLNALELKATNSKWALFIVRGQSSLDRIDRRELRLPTWWDAANHFTKNNCL